MTFDLLIKNGHVYDGTGNPWFRTDISIENKTICKVGTRNTGEAERTIDASGLVVCPGFIDMHTHSEITFLINGKAESAVRQGITTQLTGNCGKSSAPIAEERRDLILRYNLGIYRDEVDVDWISFGDYLDSVEKSGVAVNAASLVGQGTIRMCVMGYEPRKPDEEELEAMKNLVVESMEAGAFGMSVGLNQVPSGNADTDELVELCKVVARYGGVYYPHARSKGFLEDTLETIEIGERSGVSVQPVHHRPVIHKFQGDVEEVIKVMEDARLRGVDLTCNVYPYIWASSGLRGMLPHWAAEGGTKKIVERLKDPVTREKVKRDMVSPEYADTNLGFIARAKVWDKVILLNSKSEQHIGKNLLEIAEMMNVEPLDAVLNLMLSEGEDSSGLPTIQQVITKELLLKKFRHYTAMIGSDGSALAPYGILGQSRVHPRSYGCYPRILGRWVREERLISMEAAIRKMTSFPAQILGLQDRGLIRERMKADITIFDPRKVRDKATFQNPHQYPEGIKYVLVNGMIVIDEEEHTEALPGEVLRGPGYNFT